MCEDDDAEQVLALSAYGSGQKQVARALGRPGSALLEIGFGREGRTSTSAGHAMTPERCPVMLERTGGVGNDHYILGSGAM